MYQDRVRGSNGASTINELQFPGGRAGDRQDPLKFNDLLPNTNYIKHTFRKTDRFKPARLNVNGRQGRRTMGVLSSDGKEYRVLDLDSTGEQNDSVMDTSI